jgi:hypothetical protein
MPCSTFHSICASQETLNNSYFNTSTARSSLRKIYKEKESECSGEDGKKEVVSIGVDEVGCVGEGRVGGGGIESVLELPPAVLACIVALHHYLAQFNLQQVADSSLMNTIVRYQHSETTRNPLDTW